MSKKGSSTTADYLPWDEAVCLIKRLAENGKFRMSLYISLGCFFGLRVSDILSLKWVDILDKREFAIHEKKTGKLRNVRINTQLQKHIRKCYEHLQKPVLETPVIANKLGEAVSIRYLNEELKKLKYRYRLNIKNFSTHSLRKTFGRQVVTMSKGSEELALIKLCELFNHTSVAVTRRYLGLRAEELAKTYESLTF